MRRFSLALALLGAIAGAGCSASNSPSSSGSSKGVPGSTFTVVVRGENYWFDPVSGTTVVRPQYGTVASSPAGISCGPAATACSADFAWGTAVTLSAAGVTGYGYHAFAGSCSGNGDCALSGNADKMVVVRFATSGEGLGAHPNYSDAAVHGPKYMEFASGAAGALDCKSCHGANLQGQGLAVSCTGCHPWPTHNKIILRDSTGAALTRNTTAPYDPQATCGTAGCHGPSWGKITQGYHFAQGRTNAVGDIQISDNFSQKPWIISNGMYGKY